jgi:hypothetical protein
MIGTPDDVVAVLDRRIGGEVTTTALGPDGVRVTVDATRWWLFWTPRCIVASTSGERVQTEVRRAPCP